MHSIIYVISAIVLSIEYVCLAAYRTNLFMHNKSCLYFFYLFCDLLYDYDQFMKCVYCSLAYHKTQVM